MSKYFQALISAPTRDEANCFSDVLVKERLVAGCLIKEGASRYWWQGNIVEKTYWNVEAFTVAGNKASIIAKIEKLASDECPIIAFFEMDGNAKFLQWVEDSLTECDR